MTEEKIIYDRNVKYVKCSGCHNPTLLSQVGKLEYLYCQPCYLTRIEARINEWKSAYRHFRNGKAGALDRNEILKAPMISEYIN